MDKHPDTPTEIERHRLKRREPAAVERWFRQYADAVYTFIFYRSGRDEELATELVQETFLTALRRIGSFDPRRGEMLPWLTYTARNCIRAALRQKGRYRTDLDFWDRIDGRTLEACRALAVTPLPDEILERRETADLVRIALAQLPERYQSALTRHYCGRESLREIARSDGLSESAVKSLLHRARLALKSAFQAIGDSIEERATALR